MKRDFYEVLGVPRDAGAEDIKKAYRRLAMQHHPDKNHGNKDAEAKFKEISEAYDVLRSDDRRAAYDRFGHQAFEQGNAGGGGGGGGFGFAGGLGDVFEEMFGEIMGGGGRRGGGTPRGADLRYDLTLSLEEAFQGLQKTITFTALATCATCKGEGTAPGTSSKACTMCHGHGRVRSQQGFFAVEHACPTCQGAGHVIPTPCTDCKGAGRVKKQRSLAITIPPGVDDGTRMRLSGEGEAGPRHGPAGDLYVFLSITSHPLFQRQGPHLHCHVPIPMTLAALGGTLEVPLLEGGTAPLTIEPGTQSGHVMTLRHKGMPAVHSTRRGDMAVEVVVETPRHLTKRQKELLTEFSVEGERVKNSPLSEKFWAKVKDIVGVSEG